MNTPNSNSGVPFPDAAAYQDAVQSAMSRRSLLRSAAVAAATLGVTHAVATPPTAAAAQAAPPPAAKQYKMKKSINLWAFPYPQKLSLRQCLQLAKDAGFDGVELNYDLESDVSAKVGEKELTAVRKMAEEIGIAISGLCSFLFWPYPLSSNDPAKRARGNELGAKMVEAAGILGTENLLVVPGAVCIPWRDDHEPVPNDVCEQRAREAVARLIPLAEKHKVYINLENIFFNGFLMTPMEMNSFVDSFKSDRVRVHFDTGNIMEYQFPEHWIRILGKRIKNVHLKEYTKKGTDHSLEAFRPLLDGTTNWPAVLDAFADVGYDGYLTFEYFHPWQHWPEAFIFQTSDSLDRMLGRKSWKPA
ncbi:MAG TPA: sugar phosphate isomerase/epimerase family protein [Pirellulaceae bacterium]|nr:sugar phosphate isomerase/epimerase family protein [Pirellulaceae bacterium]